MVKPHHRNIHNYPTNTPDNGMCMLIQIITAVPHQKSRLNVKIQNNTFLSYKEIKTVVHVITKTLISAIKNLIKQI